MSTLFPKDFWARRPFAGILFDMDGTLVNTENDTDEAIREAMEKKGVENGFLSPALTRGCSWRDICVDLCEKYPNTWTPKELRAELVEIWTRRVSLHVEPLTGAIEMLEAASQHFPIAVVSSSPHALIDQLLDACGASAFVPLLHRVGADDVKDAKPAPECFLKGAEILGVPPEQCVVFEDSTAGLRAARSAGMASVAILEACSQPEECSALASATLDSYPELTKDFWLRLRQPS
jgi:HAD superfamily hydrolase (TIGR01509 family)